MKTSAAGIDLIKRFESLSLEAYPDPGTGGEPWTIGYGHTGGVQPDDVCTEMEASDWLSKDVSHAENSVNNLVSVPLTQGEFDALVSLVYNIGGTNFRGSTLLRCINNEDMDGASEQFLRWSHANGKTMAGLVSRREAEKELFESAG